MPGAAAAPASAPLPIDPFLPAIVDAARKCRSLVVVAPPGAGKTTRVAPALLALGRVLLLQPRRVAARSIATRIAVERGSVIGDDIGWQVRFERRFGPRTRLLVATEGVLTARLQSDPLLGDFQVIVLDEFHERSIHADLAIALAREAQRARGDLVLVVMSATLDAGPVAQYLGDAPVIEVPGRLYPLDIRHAPGLSMAAAVRQVLADSDSDAAAVGARGHVLCFLPGAREIGRTAAELSGIPGADVLALHGSLDADQQDRALASSPQRKVILATNIAETSITVEGVTCVIDSGEVKVARHDAERGIDRLDLERISSDSAAQRAGRAGRTGPGRVVRLWDARLTLRACREPDIQRIDLSAPFLDVLAWGGDPLSFPWFEPPARDRSLAAMTLLERLGAIDGGRLSALGRKLLAFPLHPRLARIVVAGGGSSRAAAMAAILSEPDFLRESGETTDSDLFPRIDRLRDAPIGVTRLAGEIRRISDAEHGGGGRRGGADREDEQTLLRAILAGYPDCVARRREPGSPRLVLASGHGAVLARESGVREGEWLVALDVMAAERTGVSEARVRLASRVEKGWLSPTATTIEHRLDGASGRVQAFAIDRLDALVLVERPVAVDPAAATALLLTTLRERGLGEGNEVLERRLRFAGLTVGMDDLLAAWCVGRTRLEQPDLLALLDFRQRRELDLLAPESIAVPSGRNLRLDYRADGSVVLKVKLQEMFGLAESPRIGRAREAVVLELLSPAGRPVQTTRDLASFWSQGYAEVRKELRARYPRHPWPEDPMRAVATARAKPRG